LIIPLSQAYHIHILTDYNAINLPVFTCSSRDYIRLTGNAVSFFILPVPQLYFSGQVKGDGGPTCFSDKESTGIPELQEWCHTLTFASRARSANMFYTHLKAFANSVKTYVNGIGDVTAIDREELRQKWESNLAHDGSLLEDDGYDHAQWGGMDEDNPFAAIISEGALYSMYGDTLAPKRDEHGHLAGVTPRLARVSVIAHYALPHLDLHSNIGIWSRDKRQCQRLASQISGWT
jgi:hypothetical protein